MIRVISIIAMIVALVAPHDTHAGGHGATVSHPDSHHAAHHADPCERDACDEGLLLTCCDVMAGHCFLAIQPQCTPAEIAMGETASSRDTMAGAVPTGLNVAREPPPPRA